jgi:hypothetical protein
MPRGRFFETLPSGQLQREEAVVARAVVSLVAFSAGWWPGTGTQCLLPPRRRHLLPRRHLLLRVGLLVQVGLLLLRHLRLGRRAP